MEPPPPSGSILRDQKQRFSKDLVAKISLDISPSFKASHKFSRNGDLELK
jgi:hypothetical protein